MKNVSEAKRSAMNEMYEGEGDSHGTLLLEIEEGFIGTALWHAGTSHRCRFMFYS